MKIKVAGIQMTCVEDRDENLKKAVRLGNMAAEGGAAIICYQPHFSSRWFPRSRDRDNFNLAEEESGPTLQIMRGEAIRLGVCMILPLFEKEGEKFYYTAFVIAKDGKIVGKYRKIHLPDIPLWYEKFYFSPGDNGYPVFEYQGLRFGIQVCWDNFFPEGARILALEGADVIFAPTAAAFHSHHKWETVMAATAIVNGIYLMRVNRVGSEEDQDFYGRSFCVDPEGEFTIGPIGLHDGVILAELDQGFIRKVRGEWDFRNVRRQDTYRPITHTD
jgi:N-carbamoylputrescine amidase